MGRPGLTMNKKFRRLALEVGGNAIARGHLELMWDSAYEAGDEVVGDSVDVELAADWKGAPGSLAAAMTKAGFLDETEGVYSIHDFWHHAPAYVRKRRTRENERRSKVDPCLSRGSSVTSQCPASDDPTGSQREQNGPTPSPSPSPLKKEKDIPSADAPVKPKREPKVRVLGGYPEELNLAMGIWRDLRKELLSEEILALFPNDPEGRFVAQVGTKGKAWEAWQKRRGVVTPEGVKITDSHILGAVKLWSETRYKLAKAGKNLSMPNLSSLINSADFEDALLRVAAPEVANAG